MEVRVLQLEKEHTVYIARICSWFYHWWGEQEGFSMDKMEAYVLHSLCEDRIPQTYILLADEELVGVYQLSVMDLDVRPDIYPWLINVYIDKPYRGKGYLNLLMQSAKENCRRLGIKEIFLYTTHEGLYEKYGLRFKEEFDTFIEGNEIQRLYSWNIKN
ncbi:GNAT family N-acetyltransferase [Anaerotignum propionicum]|uniref:GNAT family N-acetyltransferase n=1 Tax=Anaerotignum propionicum TaxID=28446 RepID=UPI00289EA8C0|nr:GNAT family N-acetyltransferase [Anaerotignum propionicum]